MMKDLSASLETTWLISILRRMLNCSPGSEQRLYTRRHWTSPPEPARRMYVGPGAVASNDSSTAEHVQSPQLEVKTLWLTMLNKLGRNGMSRQNQMTMPQRISTLDTNRQNE